ncbi:hypothetical protein DLAC_08939 [Tieghemostelium lacteum]|uniref:Alpha-type protein kinase domain-containing protein n=1 Tax=Tieghemostelium lacteum TaxID=361077 RepID=A0A151Z8P8_TIELA|nr:hypothetical protein DLAC_08939 [Tieghemostelium lacteum]|eukprot:KYQ90332.1 hypothetical protein DLAC_08939 [Tieghemostelium lacteum]
MTFEFIKNYINIFFKSDNSESHNNQHGEFLDFEYPFNSNISISNNKINYEQQIEQLQQLKQPTIVPSNHDFCENVKNETNDLQYPSEWNVTYNQLEIAEISNFNRYEGKWTCQKRNIVFVPFDGQTNEITTPTKRVFKIIVKGIGGAPDCEFVAKLLNNYTKYNILQTMESQYICRDFAELFDKIQQIGLVKKHSFQLEFLEPHLMLLKREFPYQNEPVILIIEPWINEKIYGTLAQFDDEIVNAFTHFVYEVSNGLFIPINIQGLMVHRQNILSNPTLINNNHLYFDRFLNRPIPTIQHFFRTHKCQSYCHKLGLQTNHQFNHYSYSLLLLCFCEDNTALLTQCVNNISLVCKEWRQIFLKEKLSIQSFTINTERKSSFYKKLEKLIPFYNLKLFGFAEFVKNVPLLSVCDFTFDSVGGSLEIIGGFKNLTGITMNNCNYQTFKSDLQLLVKCPKLNSLIVWYQNTKKRPEKQLDVNDYFEGYKTTQANDILKSLTIATMDRTSEPFVLGNFQKVSRFSQMTELMLNRVSVELGDIVKVLEDHSTISRVFLDHVTFLQRGVVPPQLLGCLKHFIEAYSLSQHSNVSRLTLKNFQDKVEKKFIIDLVNNNQLSLEELTLSFLDFISEPDVDNLPNLGITNSKLKVFNINLLSNQQKKLDIHYLWKSPSSLTELQVYLPNLSLEILMEPLTRYHFSQLKCLRITMEDKSIDIYNKILEMNLPKLKELYLESFLFSTQFQNFNQILGSLQSNNSLTKFVINCENTPMDFVGNFLKLDHPTITSFQCVSIRELDIQLLTKSLISNTHLTSLDITRNGKGIRETYPIFVQYLTEILRLVPQLVVLKIPIVGNSAKNPVLDRSILESFEIAVSKCTLYSLCTRDFDENSSINKILIKNLIKYS